MRDFKTNFDEILSEAVTEGFSSLGDSVKEVICRFVAPDYDIEKTVTPLYTPKANGMGFGLSICKRTIEAHGGQISAESTMVKGTTFTISLPLNGDSRGGENS